MPLPTTEEKYLEQAIERDAAMARESRKKSHQYTHVSAGIAATTAVATTVFLRGTNAQIINSLQISGVFIPLTDMLSLIGTGFAFYIATLNIKNAFSATAQSIASNASVQRSRDELARLRIRQAAAGNPSGPGG